MVTLSFDLQKCSKATIMTRKIKELTLKEMGRMAGDNHGEYIGNQLLMVMSAIQFGKSFMHDSQPYRVEDGRVLRIISGNAKMMVNMKPYRLSAGTMLVFPADTIMEIEEKDEDFDFQIFSYRDLPDEVLFKECTVFHLSEDDWALTGEYFQLLRHTLNRQPLSLKSIRFLQTALMAELQNITQKGMTVQDWIHRRIIQQAKLLLMYSDMPIGEIAEQLNFSTSSSFCKFFKKETHMTPRKYREESEVH